MMLKKQLKKFGCIFMIAVLLFTLIGCQKDGAKDASGENQEADKACRVTYTNKPQSYDEYYNNSLLRSCKNLGNTYRIKKVLEKARSGEDVTLGYIGGSIMKGDNEKCFANVSYLDFAKTYCPGGTDQCHYVNAGKGSTGSDLGSARYDYDLGQYNPDIVFIGFACNDGSGTIVESCYESLIRDCLKAENRPAIVLVLGAFNTWSAQYWMQDYGYYYDLPMVSYADGYEYMFENRADDWLDYTDDNIHPNDKGGAVVADYIKFYFEEADRQRGSEKDIEIKEPLSNVYNENMKMLNSENCTPTSLGSWQNGGSRGAYTNGWSKAQGSGNNPLVLSFRSKTVFLMATCNPEIPLGKMRVKVYYNGDLVKDNEYDTGDKNSWTDWFAAHILFIANEVGDIRVEVSAADDNPTAQLSLMSIAYCVDEEGENA